MKRDRTIRSLASLEQSGSTARVLNLGAAAKRAPAAGQGEIKPMFHNPVLNRSIILKHRLRRDEQELFGGMRVSATKVVMPIDSSDLSVGAHFMFIGQRGYSEMLTGVLGTQSRFASHDRIVLQILDECSTLDPFVLREQLRRHGIEPAPHYFEIGPADLSRMHAFVAREIAPLARLSEESDFVPMEATSRLSRKLLSSQADVETEPLRQTLKLEQIDYREGVFSWKAFLYYKWCLEETRPPLMQVVQDITAAKLSGTVSPQMQKLLQAQQARLRALVDDTLRSVGADIAIYDRAYADLVQRRDPGPFRNFLLKAPGMFDRLGEGLAAIQHLVTYWRYRFPGARAPVDPNELREVLGEFLQLLQTFEAVNDDHAATEERAKRVLLI